MKITKYLFLLSVGVLFGCQSAKKYNAFNQQKIAVKKLHKDIDFTQRKFIKMHPDSDLYIPADSLNDLFAQAKANISEPLTPSEFYKHIAPVIAAVRQGHSRVVFPSEKITKQYSKKYKDTRGPFSQFGYAWTNDTLYVNLNVSANKNVALGSKVLQINGVAPKTLYADYVRNNTSDGFNTTYIEKGFDKRFAQQFLDRFGTLDSISYVLQCQDSIYTVTNKRFPIKKKELKPQLDSLGLDKSDSLKTIKKLTKEEMILAKAKKKRENETFKKDARKRRMLGVVNGTYNRELLFPIASDSSYAVLKIKSFSVGRYKASYDSLFKTINTKKIEHLVLDLRDNPGGRIADIDELYAYLKMKDEPLLGTATVTSKAKLPGYFIAGKSLGTYVALTPVYPFLYSWVYLNTSKNENGIYTYKVAGLKNKEIKDLAYKNKLSVLVNGGSFSASCIITSNLQGSGRALVYGEETGGTFNGTVAGIMPLLKLPNSKLRVRTGLMHIKPYYTTETFGRGIFPNVEIPLTTDEVIFGFNLPYEIIYKNNK